MRPHPWKEEGKRCFSATKTTCGRSRKLCLRHLSENQLAFEPQWLYELSFLHMLVLFQHIERKNMSNVACRRFPHEGTICTAGGGVARARDHCVSSWDLFTMKGLLGAATLIGSLKGAEQVWAGLAHFHLHGCSIQGSPTNAQFIQMFSANCCLDGSDFPPSWYEDYVQHIYKLVSPSFHLLRWLKGLRPPRHQVAYNKKNQTCSKLWRNSFSKCYASVQTSHMFKAVLSKESICPTFDW